MPISPVTISVAFVHGLLSGVCAGGVPPESWLLKAGIAPALLDEPAARVTAEQYVALFRVLVAARNDEGLGFFSRQLRRGTFELLMRSAMGAATVDAAARHFCQGFGLMQDDMRFEGVKQGALSGMRIVPATDQFAAQVFVHELLLRLLARFTAWLHGGRLRPHGYDFAYPIPRQASEYGKVFSGQVRFDQPCSVIWFNAEKLQVPVRRDEAALLDFLARSPGTLIVPRRHDEATSQRVRAYLQQGRPHWPDLAAAAGALHMSVSTLQRRLADEHSSFQAIKDQLRRDLAIMRLNTSSVPMLELAGELGFSDQAAFQRAFKAWTGSAPGTYRQNQNLEP
ncbi:MAG: AraC family transcriptional regulator [Pseudomonadota bacterium]